MSFERYKKDIEKLTAEGGLLRIAMIIETFPKHKEKLIISQKELKTIPHFKEKYQSWYSEAVVCISQLLSERLEDFISYYKPLKQRKGIDVANYTVSDYLKGLKITSGLGETVAGPDAAISAFDQQLNIVESLKQRFESSLFDIRALVQADLFDNELHAAQELNKKGFHRAAGAVAGVVLEGHLRTTCKQHKIASARNAMLGKLNDLLKEKSILDTPTWRFIQHLIDLRNLCDNKMAKEPTKEDIEGLVDGVRKVTKTVF